MGTRHFCSSLHITMQFGLYLHPIFRIMYFWMTLTTMCCKVLQRIVIFIFVYVVDDYLIVPTQ